MARHIVIKVLKFKEKERILKSARRVCVCVCVCVCVGGGVK